MLESSSDEHTVLVSVAAKIFRPTKAERNATATKLEFDASSALIKRAECGGENIESAHHASAGREGHIMSCCHSFDIPAQHARTSRFETKPITRRNTRHLAEETPGDDMRHDLPVESGRRFKADKLVYSTKMLTEQIVEQRLCIAVLIVAIPPKPVAPFGCMKGFECSRICCWRHASSEQCFPCFAQQVPGGVFACLANPRAKIISGARPAFVDPRCVSQLAHPLLI